MIVKNIFYQICIYHLIITSDGWRPFNIELTHISSYSSVSFVETNSSISSRGSISLYINVLQNIPNLYSKLLVTVESTNGNRNLELINKTIDMCELYTNPKYEPIFQVFYRAFTRNGSFPKRCPVIKRLYFLKDVLIDPENFAPTLPFKGFAINAKMMMKRENNFKEIGGFKVLAKAKPLP